MMATIRQPNSRSAFLVAVAVSLLGTTSASAHQDTKIKLVDGVLVGLPGEFEPAGFDLKTKTVTISGKKVEFSEFLKGLFSERDPFAGKANGEDAGTAPEEPYDLAFSASWYHGPSSLPPYLLVRISPKDRKHFYDIMIDMEKSKVLQAEVNIVTASEQVVLPLRFEDENYEDDFGKVPVNWREIIGEWTDLISTVRITEHRIDTVTDGQVGEYPTGTIQPDKRGFLVLTFPVGKDTVKETLTYHLNDDILFLGTQSAGGNFFVQVGSEAEKTLRRRNGYKVIEPIENKKP